jgi:Sec-independent protein secretion pathway component TatC
MRTIKDFTFLEKLDWVTYNWFSGCRRFGMAMFVLCIIISPIAILFGLLLPHYMTKAYGVEIPDRFFSK